MTDQANGGLGLCHVGRNRRGHCALNGIGCDVDHLAIARQNLAAARDIIARLLPGWGSEMGALENYAAFKEAQQYLGRVET